MKKKIPHVIYEDNHLMVINKPALLPTMGVVEGQRSLVSLVKSYLKVKYRKPGNVYVGVVSRLDSFVSGIVVFARTSKAAARLSRQFAESSVTKKYLAIVQGHLAENNGTLRHWLVKDENKHRMIAVNADQARRLNARCAVLHFRKRGFSQGNCLLEIVPQTGRKHQIRVQLASEGCSIVGDRKYGNNEPFPRGIALHSQSLTLAHPTERREMSFLAEPPGYWELWRFQEPS